MGIADTGFGHTITFDSGFFAEIIDTGFSGEERDAIKVTHSESADSRHEYIPNKIVESGELEIEIAHDPDKVPPIDKAAETVTVTYPLKSGQSTAAKKVFSGFMTKHQPGLPIEERMTAKVVLKITGKITHTPAT